MKKKNGMLHSSDAEKVRLTASNAFEHVAANHLEAKGVSFDFNAGSAPYAYAVQISGRSTDTLTGGTERDYMWGRAGADALFGGAEMDNLFGDAGDDLVVGGGGGDRLFGGMGNDRLYGGTDSDGLMGGMGDDLLDEGAGHGDLNGGPGDDILIGGAGADAFMISADSGHDIIRDFTAGPGMFDHLAIKDLSWSDLEFADTPEGVKVSWADGSVLLNGVMKADLAQDDFMFADAAELPPATRPADVPRPERATSSQEGPAMGGREAGHSPLDSIADSMIKRDIPVQFAFAGDEHYAIHVGTSGPDAVAGSDAWDQLFGRDGNDQLHGGGGDDILQGDAGDDFLRGGAGSDRLDGGAGADHLSGGEMEDEVMGGDGDDEIDAGAGHDMIDGGMGNDVIRGGTGADAFMVMPDSGHDIVLDFEATGAARGAFDHIAFIDILPQHVSVRDTADGALIGWDINSDGIADGSVLLRGVHPADLTQSDFMFNEEPAFIVGISAVGSGYVF